MANECTRFISALGLGNKQTSSHWRAVLSQQDWAGRVTRILITPETNSQQKVVASTNCTWCKNLKEKTTYQTLVKKSSKTFSNLLSTSGYWHSRICFRWDMLAHYEPPFVGLCVPDPNCCFCSLNEGDANLRAGPTYLYSRYGGLPEPDLKQGKKRIFLATKSIGNRSSFNCTV